MAERPEWRHFRAWRTTLAGGSIPGQDGVTGFDPPKSYTVDAESHGMRYSTLFSFTPAGDGTEVSWTFSGTPQTLGTKIMSPIFNVLMKGTMKKCMLRDLEALRDVCERGEG